MGNLIANALRHTPAGGRVEVAARQLASGSRGAPNDVGPGVEITVRDTGSGIPADLLAHVFDRFARGAGSTGSGLGLSIARGLVELHGGTIEAESPAGGGTEIRIRLPLAPPAGPSVLR
jgi:two-component system sensor histidine kinase BaeS